MKELDLKDDDYSDYYIKNRRTHAARTTTTIQEIEDYLDERPLDSNGRPLSKKFRELFIKYIKNPMFFKEINDESKPNSRVNSPRSSLDSTEELTGKQNSKYTLLLIASHGELIFVNKDKPYRRLEHISNPIKQLNRLIQGAQLCTTYVIPKDLLQIIKELRKHNYDTLNKDNIDEVERIMRNIEYKHIESYDIDSSAPRDEYFYSFKQRNTQFHNIFQFVKTSKGEKILNKEWTILPHLTLPATEPFLHTADSDTNGIFFVCETTFIVPTIKKLYKNNGVDNYSHFDFNINQITYPAFYNIFMCPIFKQYNDFMLKHLKHGKTTSKDWAYYYGIRNIVSTKMIYLTNAYSLYNYLSNIPNVSIIDNSCESHNLDKELNNLKKLRDSYRKLGPRVGKKLVRKVTKKINRLFGNQRTKARGKRKTAKRKTTKRKTTKRKTAKNIKRNKYFNIL